MSNSPDDALTVGSLFTGLGGLDLGLERAGMRVIWQCERDPYCRAVLRKRWPGVRCFEDVSTLCLDPTDRWTQASRPDVLCGGFPCQPVSVAGLQQGDDDERWLWPDFARLIRHLRPRYVLVENVPGLLAAQQGRRAQEVFGDLADIGYDAEWASFPASAVGAPHLRYRVFIVAYPQERGERSRPRPSDAQGAQERELRTGDGRRPRDGGPQGGVPDAERGPLRDVGQRSREQQGEPWASEPGVDGTSGPLADAARDGGRGRSRERAVAGGEGEPRSVRQRAVEEEGPSQLADPAGARLEVGDGDRVITWDPRSAAQLGGWWATEPDVGRVAHGVPSRVDRLRALGNAVVPQVAEAFGRMIVEHAARS